MNSYNFGLKIDIIMKQLVKILIMALSFMLSSCVKEGHVNYSFEVYNATKTPMTVHLSSWGNYTMYINGMYDSAYKFHEVESIVPGSYLMFSASVGDDPDPWHIPASLTPAWEYITAIECGGVTIPKAYFSNQENWELNPAFQINGTFTTINLVITPELIEQLLQK